MQKKNLIGQRIAITFPRRYGQTGEIIDIDGQFLTVLMDGEVMRLNFKESELYFPIDPLGYNQKCFDQ